MKVKLFYPGGGSFGEVGRYLHLGLAELGHDVSLALKPEKVDIAVIDVFSAIHHADKIKCVYTAAEG
ncbi:MAG: hypothetical protein ACP5I3_11225, partial [Thermoproteus sp.]